MTKKYAVLLVVGSVFVAGCNAHKVNQYGLSHENLKTAKRISAESSKKIKVGEFNAGTKGNKSIFCRLRGPVYIPNDQTYESYLRDAFIKELTIAGLYSKDSNIEISGDFEHIDFSSGFFGDGYWLFRIKLLSQGKELFTAENKYIFSTKGSSCQIVAQKFVPGVQRIIGKIISHPKFADLIK